MALKKRMTTKTGFDAADAYGRVVEVQYNRNGTKATMHWFKDSSSADSYAKIGQDFVEFKADVNDKNLVAQAYDAFKKLEHLSGAEDV